MLRKTLPLVLTLMIAACADASGRFDGRAWKVGYDDTDTQQTITEYVLPGETVEAWTELVTRNVFFDPEHRIPTLKLLDLMRQGFGPDCKSFTWTVLQQRPNDVLYEWRHGGCPDTGYPAQYELARLVRCEKGLCRWAYSTKRVPADTATKARWLKIIDGMDPNSEP